MRHSTVLTQLRSSPCLCQLLQRRSLSTLHPIEKTARRHAHYTTQHTHRSCSNIPIAAGSNYGKHLATAAAAVCHPDAFGHGHRGGGDSKSIPLHSKAAAIIGGTQVRLVISQLSNTFARTQTRHARSGITLRGTLTPICQARHAEQGMSSPSDSSNASANAPPPDDPTIASRDATTSNFHAQHAQQGMPLLSYSPDASVAAPPPYEPTPEQRQQLDAFVAFLLEESQKYNLTGAKTAEELNLRHIDDCLALLPVLDSAAAAATAASKGASKGRSASSPSNLKENASQSQTDTIAASTSSHVDRSPVPDAEGDLRGQGAVRVLDIGSGAGLPGLLLAVCRPQWQVPVNTSLQADQVVMLDSLRKRCVFLEAAVDQLQLTNATVLWARAEDAGQSTSFRESFDVVTARAVADMRVLTELTLPFIRPNGCLAVAKGANPQEEVQSAQHAVKELGGADAVICHVASHGPKGQRTAVIVQKAAPTPDRYPRTPKQISRQPL